MDFLVSMILALVGALSFGWATCRMRAGPLARIAAWAVAVPWLAIYFVMLAYRSGPVSLLEWTGDAQMGPVTLAFIIIGVSWVFVGGKRNVAGPTA